MLKTRIFHNIWRRFSPLPNQKWNKLYSTNVSYKLDLKVRNVSLTNYINKIKSDYTEYIAGNKDQITSRWTDIEPVIQLLNAREEIVQNVLEASELLNDKDEEIRKLAAEEKQLYEDQIQEIDDKIFFNLLPSNEDDKISSIVLEVNVGVGGQEAMLFAKELFEMYLNYCQYKGWQHDLAEYATTEIGGIRRAVVIINGHESFRHFKHEAGVHRVQRIPQTEKAGRIHTSTVSVVCLPEPTDIDIKINPDELKIETKRSSGAGGQHVNTTDSCVRITHLPTNISVECQVDRSQIKNRKMAMARLSALLYQRELDMQQAGAQAARKTQVRSNFRNEKIRTYNFGQDRITDHRLAQNGTLHNLKGFLEGSEALNDLINQLDYDCKLNELLNIVNNN